MKKDRITRKNFRVYIRIDGVEKSLSDWIAQESCTVTNRQVRRRITEYERGNMQMSIRDLIFEPIRARGGRPKKPAKKLTDRKQKFGITDPAMKKAVCGSWT